MVPIGPIGPTFPLPVAPLRTGCPPINSTLNAMLIEAIE